jgi:hypothetical protein
MDVYHICKFVDSSVLNHQYAHLLNDISGMGTISVTAENKAIYLIFLYLSWFRMTNKQFQGFIRLALELIDKALDESPDNKSLKSLRDIFQRMLEDD